MKIERAVVATRGEPACRTVKTLKRLGIDSIMVYTQDDQNSLHAIEAQEKYEISGYTDIPSIIKTAKRSEAQAIVVGWGFLAENPKLAKACEKEKIIFVGPSEEAMILAGDKEKIKIIARKHKVPVIASSPLKAKSLVEWAQKHGLPNEPDSVEPDSVRMMLKAARGGGGMGNQIVENLADLERTIEGLKARSKKLWRSSRIFVEPLMPNVRHVEVQLLGDQHRNLAYLGTRDCSSQYDHQKIIEEAPAPFLSQEQENLLLEYALEIAKAIDYSSAGTVEFLLDSRGDIFFMEFNPRLQVEHGVTELITGLDLVEQQIRIAEGRKLTNAVNKPKLSGVAMEARVNTQRIYRETHQKFTLIPSGGIVEQVIFPEGENIRVDHSLYAGYEINTNYNPTQAKVMVWSSNRDGAIEILSNALRECTIKGVETNIPVLLDILSHPTFQKGEHKTSFVEGFLQEFGEKEEKSREDKEKAAAIGVALALALQEEEKKQEKVVVFSPNTSLWRQAGRIDQTSRGLNFRGRR